jgi:hypothetical protein
MLPSPSLKLTRYGRRCKPGLRHMMHHRQPSVQRLPPRVRLLDQGAIVGGAPTHLRFVAYSCMNFVDVVAAHVSYSERGREQDLSDEVMGEGEIFARSLRRGP